MHFASMSLGIFDFLLEWIASFVGTVLGWVFDIIMQIVGRLLFNIVKQILFIVDWIQSLFRKLAGLDMYWYTQNGTEVKKEGDILVQLFSDQTVLQVLLALSLVAVAMVIIAAVIQMIRTEFTTEGSKNSKAGIIGQAIKSIMMFFLVPVLCFGGIFVANALLKAIDTATSLGGEQSMSSQIFVSGVSSANYMRINPGFITSNNGLTGWLKENGMLVEGGTLVANERTAVNIDNAFRSNKKFDSAPPANIMGIVDTIINTIFSSTGGFINGAVDNKIASYNNVYMVSTFYNIGSMNFIILIGGSLVACYIMIITAFGLIMRLFKATVLFMISPPLIAISPLDGGNAFKEWKTAFIGQVLSGYGAIVGLNLLFIILPVVNNINLFGGLEGSSSPASGSGTTGISSTVGGMGGSIYNDLAHLLFTIVALYMVKDLIGMISKMIRADDATKSGEGISKKVGSAALTIGMAAATGGASLAAGIGGMAAAGKAKKFSGLASKMSPNKKQTKLSNKSESLFNKAAELEKTDKGKSEKLLNKAEKYEKKANNASYKKRAEVAQSKADKRNAYAEGALNSVFAQTAGSFSKVMNSTFGTKMNEKTTVAEREDFKDKLYEAAEKEVDKGGGNIKDRIYANKNISKSKKTITAGSSEAGLMAESGVKKGEEFNSKLLELISTDGKMKADIDKNAIAALGEEISAALASGLENEHTQAILRELSAQVKTITSAKGEDLSKAVQSTLSKGRSDDFQAKVTNANNYAATVNLVNQQIKNEKGGVDAEKLREIISSAIQSKNPGISQSDLTRQLEAMLKDVKKFVELNQPK